MNEKEEYEKRLRRRLKILQEKMKEGKVIFNKDLNIKDSLSAVRMGSDGEIDLNTVDGVVRSLALAVTEMHDREELKKEASLSEIQNTYFDFVERNFDWIYKIMKDKGMTPHDAGMVARKNKNTVTEITQNLNEFITIIKEFWSSTGEIAQIHVQDMHENIKGVFGGDLFPSHNENIASKCGIYTDTIILPDPFLRSIHIFDKYSQEEKAYYFVKHAMNILQYKELACANVDIPIVVVLPDFSAIEEDEEAFFRQLGMDDSIIHASKIFGHSFSSFEEMIDFSNSLDTIDKTIKNIKDPQRVLFDTEWKGDLKSQIKRALSSDFMKPFGDISPGFMLATQTLGRMSVSNELLIKSRRLNGTPILDAPTSWKFLKWKMEYDAERAEKIFNSKDLHVVQALTDLSNTDMHWLGNIPPEALIEIRKDGALDEIRNILGNGINELIEMKPEDFQNSKKQVFENMNEAFKKHKENISQLRAKKWKFVGKDIGTWIVVGSLEVAAAITGTPVWGMATIVADQVLDVPKLKDIPKSIKDLAAENSKIKKSPVGLLFDIKKKDT